MTSPWTDEALAAFLLGILPADDDSRLIGALAQDADLSARLADVSNLIDVFASLPEETPSPTLRPRLLNSLATTSRFEPFADVIAAHLDITPSEALAQLDALDRTERWKPGLFPGTEMIPVDLDGSDNDERVAVWLRMPPGMAFPEHTHLGHETVIVIQGQYLDHRGVQYPPGSVLTEDEGSCHHFVIGTQGPPFICLAVLDGGIRVDGSALTRKDLYGL